MSQDIPLMPFTSAHEWHTVLPLLGLALGDSVPTASAGCIFHSVSLYACCLKAQTDITRARFRGRWSRQISIKGMSLERVPLTAAYSTLHSTGETNNTVILFSLVLVATLTCTTTIVLSCLGKIHGKTYNIVHSMNSKHDQIRVCKYSALYDKDRACTKI